MIEEIQLKLSLNNKAITKSWPEAGIMDLNGACDGIDGKVSLQVGKYEAIHPKALYYIYYRSSNVFLIDLCTLSTNLKVLSGANE